MQRIARRVARRAPPGMGLEDLVSAGAEGLVRAWRAFDPSLGVPFELYATHRIRGAMLDELRACDVVTHHGRRMQRRLDGALRALPGAHDDESLASHLGVTTPTLARMKLDAARARALRGRIELDDDCVAACAPDAESVCLTAELSDRLARAIRALPVRSQQVLALYYQDERTQAEIGSALGVTESRVCQILRDIVGRLRAALNADDAALTADAPRRCA